MLKPGLYEQVINDQLTSELSSIPEARKAIAPIDKAEASKVLAQYLMDDPKENAEHVMLVDLARKHHLHNIGGFLIGHPKSVHKNRLLADFFKHIGNFGTSAVYQHDLHPDKGKEHYVLHYLLF